MASRLKSGGCVSTISTETIEIQQPEISTVDPSISRNIHVIPNIAEPLQMPEELGNGDHAVYRGIIEEALSNEAGTAGGDERFEEACQRLLQDLERDNWNRQPYKDARKLLLLFSCFHPQDIWFGLVEKGRVDPGPPDSSDKDWLRRSTQSPVDFQERVKILVDRKFIATDSPIDSVGDISAVKIMMNERLRKYLWNNHYDKEILRFAASCVAYSDCGDYHLQQYDIRRRLLPHVETICKGLEKRKEYALRDFYFDDLEPEQQVIARQLLRRNDDLADDFIGYVNPLAIIAYILAWDKKEADALQLLENSYTSMSHTLGEYAKASWTVVIAHLMYWGENPDLYRRALRYTQEALAVFSRLDNSKRKYYFAKRLETGLKTKWGLEEEKKQALEENETVLSQIKARFPGSVYLIGAQDDSAGILLDSGLLESSQRQYSEVFKSLEMRLPPTHWIFISLAAKIAIKTIEEKDILRKHAVTDEDKAASRRLETRKAWEGFKQCLGETHEATIIQAGRLARLYNEEWNIEGCIEIRKWIVASVRIAPDSPDSDLINRARELKFLADILATKNSSLPEHDLDLVQEIKEYLDEGLDLLQKAKALVEKDEKLLALQFGMAWRLCEINLHGIALPILRRTLATLEKIENYSLSNKVYTLVKLCIVYHKLSMHKELEELLLTEWPEPDIPSDEPKYALECLREKAKAYIDHGFPEKAILLIERIQMYLVSLQKAPEKEILEERLTIAECLEISQDTEVEKMYNSILETLKRRENVTSYERHFKFLALRELGDILHARGERRLAVSNLQKAQAELKAYEDRRSASVQLYEASITYDIAKFEWQIYAIEHAEPTFMNSAEEHFKKVLTFQDDNGQFLLDDHCIGRTFYYLGYIGRKNQRDSQAESHLIKSLLYLCKERHRDIDAIDASYHLLFRSIWEDQVKPDANKLDRILDVKFALLSRFGVLDLTSFTQGQDNFMTIAELLAFDWRISKETPTDTADLVLRIISELGLLLNTYGLTRSLAHMVMLKVLRTCEEVFEAGDWRCANALYLLEYVETFQLGEEGSWYINDLGFALKYGDAAQNLWSEPGFRSPETPWEVLSDEKSKTLVRCGKWESVIAQLPSELRERLVYKAPPDTSGRPRSWTFIPDVAKLTHPEKRAAVPLRIAGAPVIIPAPKSYTTAWSNVQLQDPHAPIDPAEPLSINTIFEIFREYDFAQGFYMLLNKRLQIVIDDDFDCSGALAKKPTVFGGLQVDYVRNLLDHTSSNPPGKDLTDPPPYSELDLRINSRIVATKYKRPIMGLFGKPIETSEANVTRIGVRVRQKGIMNGGRQILTIPTHTFQDFRKETRKCPAFSCSLRKLGKMFGGEVKVFEANTGKEIGKIERTFDEQGRYLIEGITAPDISLVRPFRQDDIVKLESPIKKLTWISETNWDRLKGTTHHSVSILQDDGFNVEPRHTNEYDCTIVGEGVFLNKIGGGLDCKVATKKLLLKAKESSVSRCILFRVRGGDWGAPDPPASGMAVYTTISGMENPSLVGFISFKQDAVDEGKWHKPSEEREMKDEGIGTGNKANVAFFGAWKLPQELTTNYEIV